MYRNILRSVVMVALALALSVPYQASAQVTAGGLTKFTLAGGGFIGSDFASMANIFGITYFAESGIEFGGDLVMTLSKFGEGDLEASGTAFARLTYNFIGESLFVPFISAGIGAPLESDSSTDYLVDLGVGFKKFISDRVSFDAAANYQGESSDGSFEFKDGLSLFYGLSIYVGG